MTDKIITNVLTILILLPLLGLFSLGIDLRLAKKCGDIGKKFGIETRERFFLGCQFKIENKWYNIKNFYYTPEFKDRNISKK